MYGKKTERLWLPRKLCFDPFMAALLRDRAMKNSRKLEDEIRFLIAAGLEQEDSRVGKGPMIPFGGMEQIR